MSRAQNDGRGLTIVMLGTRGVPAAYGGFETAVEEIGRRLVDRGHEVTVYSRADRGSREHLGMRRVWLPAMQLKQLETLSHTGLSTVHTVAGRRPDVAFVFNAANSPFLPLLRARRIPTALHMDGLEWKRAKWGRRGRAYYRWAEEHGVRWADRLIADAPGIADYYLDEFGVETELLRYGAPLLERQPEAGIESLGIRSGAYHLVVARFEPENHVLEIVQGYSTSAARQPLVVVGSAPYAADYTRRIQDLASHDPRIRLLGGVWDQGLLDALYAHAMTYLHGHSVGGTNPSLLRAMGAGTATIALDVGFNREILDEHGWYFDSPRDVAAAIETAEADPPATERRGQAVRAKAAREFTWDAVTDGYEAVAARLAEDGPSPRRRSSRRRSSG